MSAEDNLRKIIEASSLGEDAISKMFGTLAPKITVRRACKQKNRVKPGKKDPRCGKCGLPL